MTSSANAIAPRSGPAEAPNAGELTTALARRRRARASIRESDVTDEGRGRTALVTGGSSGIGWSMCELLAAKGYDVIPVARREERLKDLASQLKMRWGIRAHPLSCDLAEPGAAAHIRDELLKDGHSVDFLVNNAGYVLRGPYIEMTWEDQNRFIRVMSLSVAELSYYLLPHMVEQRWGRLICMSSVAGVMPGLPGRALYSATKSFVHKLTEGLAGECQPYGVHCTVAVVGSTDTDLLESTAPWVSQNPVLRRLVMRPEIVARQAYDACMRGQRVVINGWSSKVWAAALVHTPSLMRYNLVRLMDKLERQQEQAALNTTEVPR